MNLTRGISWRQPCNTVQSAHPKGTHLALAHTGTRLQHVDQAHAADIKASRTCCIDLAGPRRLDSITRAVRCDSYSSTSSIPTSPTKKLSISRDERTIPNHSKCVSSHFGLPIPRWQLSKHSAHKGRCAQKLPQLDCHRQWRFSWDRKAMLWK